MNEYIVKFHCICPERVGVIERTAHFADTPQAGSIVDVNFGSITVQQVIYTENSPVTLLVTNLEVDNADFDSEIDVLKEHGWTIERIVSNNALAKVLFDQQHSSHNPGGTYRQIQQYVKEKHGVTPKTCHIAHAKEVYGLPVKLSPNRYDANVRQVPADGTMLRLIKGAFIHFGMLEDNSKDDAVCD